jgi:RNA polymerase sigma-70 factor (sigma-E family)
VTEDVVSSGRPARAPAPSRDEAIAALFYGCYPRLAQTAFGLTGDWAVAEELVQEAFVRVWRRWRLIRDPEAAPAYLHRTVVNLGCSVLRRRALERRVLDRRVAYFRSEQPADTDPAADVELHHAIAALSARKRACVVLRYLSGLTEAETAEALGVSLGTVKSQTHKALRQLREQLSEPDQNELPGRQAEGKAT